MSGCGRIRSIKPELLDDERTASLSDLAFRLFVASILLADDYGRLRAAPRLLRGAVYWARDEVSLASVEDAVRELEAAHLLVRYEVDGQSYGYLRGWAKHQRVDHPGKPRIPPPPETLASLPPPPRDPRESIPQCSTDSRDSRETLALPRETLGNDQDQDQDQDQKKRDRGDRPPSTDPPTPVPDPRGSPVEQARPLPIPEQSPDQTPEKAPSSPPKPPRKKAPLEDVREVFDHWRVALGHTRAVLDAKRRGLLERALDLYPKADCLRAIDGCARSDWHTGRDPKTEGKRYDDLGLIFRDAAHIEQFLALAAPPPRKATPARVNPALLIPLEEGMK